MFKWEKNIISFLEKYYLEIGLLIVTFLSLYIRFISRNFESPDYTVFLSPWFDYLKNNGGLKALATYPGDYNAPYVTIMALLTYIPINKLYLIKGVSVIFDFALAISSAYLVSYLVKKDKKLYFALTYTAVLFLPEVILNSGIWAQCDAGYATFIILALLFMLKEKYIKSFIFLGISFALKLQFIFIFPLFVILYISKKQFSFLHFMIIPIVNFILCLPAILFGKPISEVLMVYINQTGTYSDRLVLNFPNIYNLLQGEVKIFYKVGTICTLLACALMLAYVIYKKVKWNNEKILTLGLWSIVITTFILPGMHERYLYVGAILSVICYILYRKNLSLTLFIIISSIITYTSFLFTGNYDYLPYLSAIYLIIIVIFTKNTLKLLESD